LKRHLSLSEVALSPIGGSPPAAEDNTVTVGFESDDCDPDYQTVIDRRAVSLDPPANRPWALVRPTCGSGQPHVRDRGSHDV